MTPLEVRLHDDWGLLFTPLVIMAAKALWRIVRR